MYATPTSSLTDGGLTLLNTFSQSGSAPNHEQGTMTTTDLESRQCLPRWCCCGGGVIRYSTDIHALNDRHVTGN